jgi:hypothetical protein
MFILKLSALCSVLVFAAACIGAPEEDKAQPAEAVGEASQAEVPTCTTDSECGGWGGKCYQRCDHSGGVCYPTMTGCNGPAPELE